MFYHSASFISKNSLILLIIFFSFSLLRTCKGIVEIPNFDLSSTPLDPTKTGFSLTGSISGDKLGYSLGRAGDINGDGYADLVLGAYGKDSSIGAAYVIYGHPSFSSSAYLALDPTALDPRTTGFSIKGNAVGNSLGYSAKAAGDVNKDGYDDIIVGAPNKNSNQGAVYVIYGGPTSSRTNIDLAVTNLDPGTTGFVITGNAGGYLGKTVSTAGDLDHDGYDDILIGAPNKNSNQGTVYVIYGGPTSSRTNIDLAVTSLDPGATGFTITGQANNHYLGKALSSAGNVNNDDYDDIIIEASNLAYIVYGKDRSTFVNINLATDILDPATTGFTITGNGNNFGLAVDTAGDLNQDGYDDVLIGAYSGNGMVYVIYGGETSLLSNINLAVTTLDPQTTGFTITDSSSSDHLGYSTSAAGDVNGDGYADIIAGQDNHFSTQGAAYVIYGGPKGSRQNVDVGTTPLDPGSTGFMLTGKATGDKFGTPVSRAGDLNGDGYDDIIVGAYQKDSSQGAVYIIYSSCVSSSGTCKERVFCESCEAGYRSTNSKCQDCPSNCQEYSGPKTCKTCDDGYVLSNSLCVVSYSFEKKLSKTVGAISNAANLLGGALSVGSSLLPVTKLVSKIVQNTRYIGLTVTEELSQVYQDWDTNLINVEIPETFSSLVEFKSLSTEFSRYDLNAAFLVNFWSDLVTLGAITCTFIMSYALKKLLERGETNIWGYSLVNRVSAASSNLALVQAYGCLDDVIFYFVLDVQTNPFDEVFAWASFFSALAFICLVGLLILWNIIIIKRYQRAKSNDNLKAFTENNKCWELFYGDFKDDDYWSHSFLAILAVRNCLSSMIVSGLYNYPLLQTSLLIILDGAIIIILMTLKPLNELLAQLAQYFYQITALLVHCCTFILAMEGEQVSVEKIGKIAFCKAIIFLNYALIIGGICLMLAEIYKSVSVKIKTWKLKQKDQSKNVNLEDSVNQSVISTVKPLDLSTAALNETNPQTNIRRARVLRQQIESNEIFERPSENQRISTNVKRGGFPQNSSVLKEKKKRKEVLIIAKAKQNFNFNYG